MSIKLAEKIQVSMSVIKLVAAGIIMAGGFYSLAQGTCYFSNHCLLWYMQILALAYTFSVLP